MTFYTESNTIRNIKSKFWIIRKFFNMVWMKISSGTANNTSIIIPIENTQSPFFPFFRISNSFSFSTLGWVFLIIPKFSLCFFHPFTRFRTEFFTNPIKMVALFGTIFFILSPCWVTTNNTFSWNFLNFFSNGWSIIGTST